MTLRLTHVAVLLGFAAYPAVAQQKAPTPAPLDPPAPVALEPAPIAPPTAPAAPSAGTTAPAKPEEPAPIEPPVAPAPADAPVPGLPGGGTAPSTTDIANLPSAGAAVHDFQGDEIGTVLRLLARQAKIPMVVSDRVQGTVTLRIEGKSPLEVIEIICTSKNLFLDQVKGVYYVKTQEERASEPTEPGSYTFSYAKADVAAPLLQSQLRSGIAPQVDVRTNTVFYREVISNKDVIVDFLRMIDKPTQQVMIEARLVEVNANPKQSYGINWGGVVGSAASPQTLQYGASLPLTGTKGYEFEFTNGKWNSNPLLLNGGNEDQFLSRLMTPVFGYNKDGMPTLMNSNVPGQLAILSIPQMSVTMRLLNEDADAEFLANPRIVTANNQSAKIKITRNQPVPQLNFNEQTATAVFGGFEDKEFGNTLQVTPSINKDDFVTLGVKPEISNKVGDATFLFAGAAVSSPIIDKRELDSNVLIKSGDTLAIGGLLQDEVSKGRTKVPVLGDIPIIGYAFQERLNARTKRNLLIFVTPTIIKQGYGTGLEDQVNGLKYTGEEYADPNGWRNNARGTVRLVPTSNRQVAADYPAPGTAIQPDSVTKYKTRAPAREK